MEVGDWDGGSFGVLVGAFWYGILGDGSVTGIIMEFWIGGSRLCMARGGIILGCIERMKRFEGVCHLMILWRAMKK